MSYLYSSAGRVKSPGLPRPEPAPPQLVTPDEAPSLPRGWVSGVITGPFQLRHIFHFLEGAVTPINALKKPLQLLF